MTQVEEKRALPSSPSPPFLLLPGEGMHCPENERRERKGDFFCAASSPSAGKKGRIEEKEKKLFSQGEVYGKKRGRRRENTGCQARAGDTCSPSPPLFLRGPVTRPADNAAAAAAEEEEEKTTRCMILRFPHKKPRDKRRQGFSPPRFPLPSFFSP